MEYNGSAPEPEHGRSIVSPTLEQVEETEQIAQTLMEQENLAAEGYYFYAQEASEFAASSARAVAEALKYDLTLK
jgi:hypothetical protein